jgi:ribosomal peptide maturation radical SAM protein 1
LLSFVDSPPVLGDPDRLSLADRRARAGWPVALVNMPFASVSGPSLALGLLKPIVTSHGFDVKTFHLNVDFAAQVGVPVYEVLCEYGRLAIGDWVFSLAAFGAAAPDPDDRLLAELGDDVAAGLGHAVTVERLRRLRHDDVEEYLEGLLLAVPWDRFRVVGFSSTFHQNVASLALAGALKRRHPHIHVVFGGANLDGDMGAQLVRSMPWVDSAISGEGDRAFPQLLVALTEGRDVASVPGVITRRGPDVVGPAPAPLLECLDELPMADYDEYFERTEATGLRTAMARRLVVLPFESARGCWWGERRHCTFCGLNGSSMAFRAKSPERVEKELSTLARRYRSFDFEAVDNILDPAYLETLFERLAAAETSYNIFYEVKANLSRSQLETLWRGGVRAIQPGIESLSSHVLRLMRKGVRAAQNVNLLRWATYFGMRVTWNLLWGFPGETEDDYRLQSDILSHLVHLPPPMSADRILMERFSPIFSDRDRFPVSRMGAEASLAFIYPQGVDLDRIAYIFEYQFPGALSDSTFEPIVRQVDRWTEAWQSGPRPTLNMWSTPGFVQIEDHRPTRPQGTYTFHDPLATLYLACNDHPVTAREAAASLAGTYSGEDVTRALDEFVARGLMFRDENLFIALALPATGGV